MLANGVSIPIEKAGPGLPKGLSGRTGVDSTFSKPFVIRNGRIALGVAEKVPALHPSVLKVDLCGLPATDSDFTFAVKVSITLKSSTVNC